MDDALERYVRDHEIAIRNWSPDVARPEFQRPVRSGLGSVGYERSWKLYNRLLKKRVHSLCAGIYGQSFSYRINDQNALALFHLFCLQYGQKIEQFDISKAELRNRIILMNLSRTSNAYGVPAASSIDQKLRIMVSHHYLDHDGVNTIELEQDGTYKFGIPGRIQNVDSVLIRADALGSVNCRHYLRFRDRMQRRYGGKLLGSYESCRVTLHN